MVVESEIRVLDEEREEIRRGKDEIREGGWV